MRTTKLAGLTALSLVLFACGSDDGGSNAPATTNGAGVAPPVLVKGSPVGPDATCAAGGTRIDVGADKNGNGQLDPDEVTGSQVVCNAGAAPTLTTVTPTGPSAKCTNGGMTVKSGPDTNGNGKLDDAEVTSTDEICSGGTSTELASTTPIPDGDARCPFGGQSSDVGFDDGANGGVPGDGVLQPGEVKATVVSCTTGAVSDLVPPSGPDGTFKLLASGGNGTTTGGNGSSFVSLGTYTGFGAGMLGGNVKIWKTGTLAADVQVPTVTPTFGTTKLEVTANKTIPNYGSPSNAADGDYYTLNNSGLFLRQNGQQIAVTGVHVAPNVTLTFASTAVSLMMSDDFHNEGVVTTAMNGNNRGSLSMTVARFIGSPASKIDLTGGASANAAGGNGGAFLVTADAVYDQGAIDTSGGNGDPNANVAGGAAGVVFLNATRTPSAGPAYQTGNVKVAGGTGRGQGGSGGPFQLIAASKGGFVHADLDLRGGKGGTGGGNAGFFSVQATGGGAAVVDGTLLASGGDVDEVICGNAACSGGPGGGFNVIASGGDLIVKGALLGHGGKGKNGPGGPGSSIVFVTNDGTDPTLNLPRPGGSARVAADIDVRGGDGSVGGPGPLVRIGVDSNTPNGQEVEMFGYTLIDASGGDGPTQGGNGGQIWLANKPTSGNRITGGLAVYPDVRARGGNALTSGGGGNGGLVQLLAAADGNTPGTISTSTPEAKASAIVAKGNLDASGGSGFSAGGAAGTLDIRSRERVDLFGTLTAKGGSSSNANGAAGSSPAMTWKSGTAFNLASVVTLGGGTSTGATSTGGACGALQILSGAIQASAAIACNGGAGTGAGGASGGITLTSSQKPTSYSTLSAFGGNGSPQGANGAITVDGNTL